jgi:RimJ/RimL family protein N-acetyltransferase
MPSELMTARLRLRQWQPSDAVGHRSLWLDRDPRSLRLIDAEGRPSVEDLEAWGLAEAERSAELGFGLLAIETRADAAFIGYCGLIEGQASADEPEIAYELARHAHGFGYATEAARAVVDAAARTGRSRLWATVRAWNTASFRVLAKLDFHDSGRRTPDADRGDSVWMTRRL